jgi:hypothetical protein
MSKLSQTLYAGVLTLCCASGQVAFSASKAGLGSSISGGGKKSDRNFLVALPIMTESNQLQLHLEYDVDNVVGVAIEGGFMGEQELASQKEIDENGSSLKTKGSEAALLFSRYSEPNHLGGFYWTLGAGYRQYIAEWKKKPETDPQTGLADTRLALQDDQGYLHHRMSVRGAFATGRLGYRYVATDWPFTIGAHIGLRHLSSTVQDVEVDETEQETLKLQYSQTTSAEKKTVKHHVMTTPDFTLLEIGMAF